MENLKHAPALKLCPSAWGTLRVPKPAPALNPPHPKNNTPKTPTNPSKSKFPPGASSTNAIETRISPSSDLEDHAGARTSTLLARLPFLPAADAYASENGGRLFFPHSPLPTAALLSEDMDWRARHNAVGEQFSFLGTCRFVFGVFFFGFDSPCLCYLLVISSDALPAAALLSEDMEWRAPHNAGGDL